VARVIGLDYDHKNKAVVRKAIKHIIDHFKPFWIHLSISPSGTGYHLKFKTPNNYSDLACIEIRKNLGDDPNRISVVYNEDRSWKYRDVLFDMKMVDGKIMKSVPLDVATFLRTGREVVLDG
jgi:hypothetical protein